jgi:F-type H+-transporting ATPase subunit delta
MKNIYKTEYKKIYRIVSVDAKVSHVMDDLEIKRLQEGIESNLHMSADLQVGVDPTLLGGIKMRIDNIYLDATVLGKMKRLRENLLQS